MSEYRTEIQKQFPLEGVGTRYEHYGELRELFALGIQIIEGMDAKYKTKSDLEKLTKLRGAIELIDHRVNLLSGFDQANNFSSNFAMGLRVIDRQRTSGRLEGYKPILQLPEVTDSTRQQCEAEMKQAEKNGYSFPTPDKPGDDTEAAA